MEAVFLKILKMDFLEKATEKPTEYVHLVEHCIILENILAVFMEL